MQEILDSLVATAKELARIQLEGVQDAVGFSNADKFVGMHLASVVQADPSDEGSITALASLVGNKYARQAAGIAGEAMVAEFKKIAKGAKLTQDQRNSARKTVIVQTDTDPKWGTRVLFSFQFSQDFAFALKDNGGRAFHGNDGWKWAVRPAHVTKAVADLKARGARIIGSFDNVAPSEETESLAVSCDVRGKIAVLSFPYSRPLVDAVKEMPWRRYDAETKSWSIKSADLAVAAELFQRCGADVSALIKASADVQQNGRPAEVEESPVTVPPHLLSKAMVDLSKGIDQVTGIQWLCEPLTQVRQHTLGGASIRGKILGDKQGLGKTMESAIAASCFAGEGERILVVCPATLKLNWTREIRKFIGEDESICILENGKSKVDRHARWIIVNFDILGKFYFELTGLGYAVLLVDEAHYIKNRESVRGRYIIGGTVSVPHEPTRRDPRKKIPRKLDGLAFYATKRVIPMTGTPLTNRPKDLFNLLRAIGHPLGKNWRLFANRYCNPQTNAFGTTYTGASNIQELREKLEGVFLQRQALTDCVRTWLPVEVDLKAYREVMARYAARRKAGELSSADSHLAMLTEARVCTAVAKVKATIERVESALQEDKKVIVFSVYTQVIENLQKHFGDKALVINGNTKNKDATAQQFQNDESKRVLIGNFMNGQGMAVGLNLTAATHVVFNDLDWVPANHEQAWKRADRIGQTQQVTVEFVLAAGTFDEELAVLLEEKFEIVSAFEGTTGSLFLDLLNRLEKEAPKNTGVKALGRDRSATHVAA